jgi:hypothetical protein
MVLSTTFVQTKFRPCKLNLDRTVYTVFRNIRYLNKSLNVQRKHINYSIWPIRISRHDLRRRYSNSLVIDAGSQFSLRACSQASRIHASVCRPCLKRIQPMPNVPLAYASLWLKFSIRWHTLIRYAIVWQGHLVPRFLTERLYQYNKSWKRIEKLQYMNNLDIVAVCLQRQITDFHV